MKSFCQVLICYNTILSMIVHATVYIYIGSCWMSSSYNCYVGMSGCPLYDKQAEANGI